MIDPEEQPLAKVALGLTSAVKPKSHSAQQAEAKLLPPTP